MSRVSESELERLKKEISLLRLVEASGVELKKSGKDYVCLCPFHEDKTASLVVTPAKNLFHCFGCGAAGGVIDWVMKMRGLSFRHAVELLRNDPSLAAAPLDHSVKRSTVRTLADQSLVETASSLADAPDPLKTLEGQRLMHHVLDYYHATLKNSPEALAYLESRGLNHSELISHFKLGYANRTLSYRLPNKNRKDGAEARGQLERIGIYRSSGHEHFNGSLVIPVIDREDRVREVYGRKILDNLRTGTAYHLYLPGSHGGVWNEGGIAAAVGEVILCEALIDAMTFWVNGFRNVTASYGVNGFTGEHLDVFKKYGIKRILIAYDRDEPGDRAAEALAEVLCAEGIECYRIQFPKGMDANDYALKMQPSQKALGLLIRKAQWMGKGESNHQPKTEPIIEPSSLAALPVSQAQEQIKPPQKESAAKEEALKLDALPASPVPPASSLSIEAEVKDQEVIISFGEGISARRWRVRGLPKNLAIGVLKVNVMVSSAEAFHVDTLDLYAARSRAAFVQQASLELRVKEELLKTELGRVLLKLEQLQDQNMTEALKPKEPAAASMSEEEHEAALELLRSPHLLSRLLEDFERCGVVGEATNKLAGYLAATSRKLDRPLAVVIQSSSAAGKSSLMDAILAFMPPEETVRYSAMTGQSLFYMGETNLKHKVLAIAEEEGAHRASYALKLLQSEGELTIASTGSDANGNLITQEYRVEGPMTLFMTTTAIDVDEELMNRCLVLSVDEGREQTRAIHARQRSRRTLEGLLAKEEKQIILDTHRNAQRLLRPLAIVNPYADQLTFLDDRTRTRRDHEKYLSLIDIITLLHQHQRQIKTISKGNRSVEYVEVTLKDIEYANQLAHEVLGRSLDDLPPQTRKLLGMIQEQVKAQPIPIHDVRFSRAEVRRWTGLSDTQCCLHLERLTQLEYLLIHRGKRGQSYEYELLYDAPIENDAPYLAGLIDVNALANTKDTATNPSSWGQNTGFTDGSRPQHAPETGGIRSEKIGCKPDAESDGGESSRGNAKNAPDTEEQNSIVPYPQKCYSLAAGGY